MPYSWMEHMDGIQVSYLDLPTMLAPFAKTADSSPVKVGGSSFTSLVSLVRHKGASF